MIWDSIRADRGTQSRISTPDAVWIAPRREYSELKPGQDDYLGQLWDSPLFLIKSISGEICNKKGTVP